MPSTFGFNNSLSISQKLQQLNWGLIILLCLVACVGFVSLYSAAGGNMQPWVSKQFLRFVVGLCGMAAIVVCGLAGCGDGFLGEETGAEGLADAEGVWVIDPVDGTQPFVSGMPSWCVSIAYVHRGELQFGFVHNPPLDELFEGGRGRPGLLNGRPVAPHPGRSLTDGIVSVGYSPRIGVDDVLPVLDRLLRQGGTFYRNGSGALSLCYVGCGRLLGYVEPHINSWDCLAALAVIESAGGRTNDFLTGDALLAGNRIVAAAPAVYDALDAVLG